MTKNASRLVIHYENVSRNADLATLPSAGNSIPDAFLCESNVLVLDALCKSLASNLSRTKGLFIALEPQLRMDLSFSTLSYVSTT